MLDCTKKGGKKYKQRNSTPINRLVKHKGVLLLNYRPPSLFTFKNKKMASGAARGPKAVVTDQGLDLRRLERAIDTALESEARYDRENAAKFRAVAQRVRSAGTELAVGNPTRPPT